MEIEDLEAIILLTVVGGLGGQISAIYTDNDELTDKYFVLFRPYGQNLQFISHLNENCDHMCYVLLYSYGESGYTNLPHTRTAEKGTRIGNVSEKEFYMCRIAHRDQSPNHIHACGNNQDKIRVQNYCGLTDHLTTVREEEELLPGSIFVLPSTFTGSERNMRQHYQDAMSLVAKF
ncbi:unnamed protein product, partial [Brachionus calyciflorus]